MILLTAPWVLPVCGPPCERGAVLVHEGGILAVGTERELRATVAGIKTVALEDAALMPGLVNAHAHLELTTLGCIEGSPDFTGWIREVIRLKRSATGEDFARGAFEGSVEALRLGQTTVADVVSNAHSAQARRAAGQRVLNLAEVIAASDENAGPAIAAALNLLKQSDTLHGGLFPHTPFTVGARGFKLAAEESVCRFGRYFTHLAESPDEVEFCLTGGGPIAGRVYAGLPVAPPAHPGVHPFDYLDSLGLVHSGAVLVHCVQVGHGHIARLAGSGARVVLCPRSNRTLGVGKAPGRKLADAGVIVGLGTDSVLSGGDLDMFGEVRAAVEDYGFTPEEALAAATSGSAAALGLSSSIGALKAGMRADILAVSLGEGNTPSERVLNGGGAIGVWSGGERVQ